MITLATHGRPSGIQRDLIGRVTLHSLPMADRGDAVRVLSTTPTKDDLSGYLAVITPGELPDGVESPVVANCPIDHLADKDIILANSRGYVRTLIRHGSPSNALFATDRCNSLCLMCSQPPRDVDDSDKAAEMIRTVSLIDPSTKELGITGGEPTLLGDDLLRVIEACRTSLPHTSLHMLTNGRRFRSSAYAEALAQVKHPDLMLGIPVYSDTDSLHDHVVQAKGAFEETIGGLHNLANLEVPVEIRVVLQRLTAPRLLQLAEFIYRNLPFASHVTFMGLEIVGFTKPNLEQLWIDPEDYASQLEAAVLRLAAAGLNVSIYNHQLCRVPQSVWPFCRQSISDWKNEYAAECDACDMKKDCGGFFAWNLQHPKARIVRPITTLATH